MSDMAQDPTFRADIWDVANQPGGERAIVADRVALERAALILNGCVAQLREDPASWAETLSVEPAENWETAFRVVSTLGLIFTDADTVVKEGR